MIPRVVSEAVDDIIREQPSVNSGSAHVHPEPDFTEDVSRVQITRFYPSQQAPPGFAKEPDGSVTNNYHIYLSTSALALLEIARTTKPADQGLDGIVYIEVEDGDQLSDNFRHTQTASGSISPEMIWDTAYLLPTLGRIQGGKITNLTSFAGGKTAPSGDDFDLSDEIVELLQKLSKALSEGTEALGKAIKVPSTLWETKDPTKAREIIEETKKGLRVVADGLKSGISGFVGTALGALDKTLSLIEKLFKSGAEAVVDFFSEVAGSLASSAQAAKETAKLVLGVLQTVRDKVHGLQAFATKAADWFNRQFGDLEESVDVLVGYFSGVWNGLVDAVLGIFDTINLVVTIILGLFRLADVAEDAWNLSLEIIDEIIGSLDGTSLDDMWDTFTTKTFPDLKKTLTEKGQELVDAFDKALTSNNAAVGYYFGYLVYMVAESFFPPIKLTKVAVAARGSSKAARAFLKRLSKFDRD